MNPFLPGVDGATAMKPPPPNSEQELLERANALAGRPLEQIANLAGRPCPADLRHNKGWHGQLLETLLGASAGSLAEPDFQTIGVELKTLPIDHRGLPKESTYVCTVPLENQAGTWEQSWVHNKLRRVLWMPVEADTTIPLARRRIGTPLLWSPDTGEETALRQDWEELMDMVCLGELEKITAHHGNVLQIRPKAADAKSLTWGIGANGDRIPTTPRGFYLRSHFTAQILHKNYIAPPG